LFVGFLALLLLSDCCCSFFQLFVLLPEFLDNPQKARLRMVGSFMAQDIHFTVLDAITLQGHSPLLSRPDPFSSLEPLFLNCFFVSVCKQTVVSAAFSTLLKKPTRWIKSFPSNRLSLFPLRPRSVAFPLCCFRPFILLASHGLFRFAVFFFTRPRKRPRRQNRRARKPLMTAQRRKQPYQPIVSVFLLIVSFSLLTFLFQAPKSKLAASTQIVASHTVTLLVFDAVNQRAFALVVLLASLIFSLLCVLLLLVRSGLVANSEPTSVESSTTSSKCMISFVFIFSSLPFSSLLFSSLLFSSLLFSSLLFSPLLFSSLCLRAYSGGTDRSRGATASAPLRVSFTPDGNHFLLVSKAFYRRSAAPSSQTSQSESGIFSLCVCH
jgi:hypothetical protein